MTEKPKWESLKTLHNVIKQTKQKEWEKEETKKERPMNHPGMSVNVLRTPAQSKLKVQCGCLFKFSQNLCIFNS